MGQYGDVDRYTDNVRGGGTVMDFEEMARKITEDAADARQLGAAIGAVGAGSSLLIVLNMMIDDAEQALEDAGVL
jgi:hypothetical protein